MKTEKASHRRTAQLEYDVEPNVRLAECFEKDKTDDWAKKTERQISNLYALSGLHTQILK